MCLSALLNWRLQPRSQVERTLQFHSCFVSCWAGALSSVPCPHHSLDSSDTYCIEQDCGSNVAMKTLILQPNYFSARLSWMEHCNHETIDIAGVALQLLLLKAVELGTLTLVPLLHQGYESSLLQEHLRVDSPCS